jgi:hypothetical protein
MYFDSSAWLHDSHADAVPPDAKRALSIALDLRRSGD